MPKAEFGRELDLPASEGRYIRLKSQGDKIKFRIAGTPVYQVDHWVEGEKIPCKKYGGGGGECSFCEDYRRAVELGDEEMQRKFRPVTTFLYPILNRVTGKAQIFQFTAKSIHYAISGYAKEGVDVFGCDWVVERTEEPGSGYYSVMRLGSEELTEEEQAQLERARGFLLEGKSSKSVELSAEEKRVADEVIEEEVGNE